MEKAIINYILSVGLTMEDALYYINNGYNYQETIKAIEEVNNSLSEFLKDEF